MDIRYHLHYYNALDSLKMDIKINYNYFVKSFFIWEKVIIFDYQ